MDNLGKCHGKINIMIGLKANGSSSNWLPPIHCRTCDAHMSISNKPHHKETKANTVKCWKTHLPPASPLLPYRSNVNYCSCLISMKEIFFFLKWATSIYLKCSILSVSVDLAKKSKFYETQAAVLLSVYTDQHVAVAKSTSSTPTTSSVHLCAPSSPLAQFHQVHVLDHLLCPTPCEASKMPVFAHGKVSRSSW